MLPNDQEPKQEDATPQGETSTEEDPTGVPSGGLSRFGLDPVTEEEVDAYEPPAGKPTQLKD